MNDNVLVRCHKCKAEFYITELEYAQSPHKYFWCSDECKWDDRTYAKSKRQYPTMTGPEKRIWSLIKKYDLPYQYTGNQLGLVKIGNLIPDFANADKKIAIEFFGCYWHKCPLCYPAVARTVKSFQTEEGRKSIFKKYGWEVIILWEHDMDKRNWRTKLLQRIEELENATDTRDKLS